MVKSTHPLNVGEEYIVISDSVKLPLSTTWCLDIYLF